MYIFLCVNIEEKNGTGVWELYEKRYSVGGVLLEGATIGSVGTQTC